MQNATNEISSLGVASNRDETVTLTKADYDRMQAELTSLGTTVNTLTTKINELTTQNTMSETEHFTGEYWSDGRKIYEVTKTFTTAANAGNRLSTGIVVEGIDNVRIDSTNTYIHVNKGTLNEITYGSSYYVTAASYYCIFYNIKTGEFLYHLGSDFVNCQAYLTIRYTKTSELPQNTDD